jgi:hypothetical protein
MAYFSVFAGLSVFFGSSLVDFLEKKSVQEKHNATMKQDKIPWRKIFINSPNIKYEESPLTLNIWSAEALQAI